MPKMEENNRTEGLLIVIDGRRRCMRSSHCSSILRVLSWIVRSLLEGFLEVLSGMLTGMLTTGDTLLNGYPGTRVPGPRYSRSWVAAAACVVVSRDKYCTSVGLDRLVRV